MTETTGTPAVEIIKTAIEEILKTIEQEREREIVTRRFGLYDRRETLEQIGELLGITRERVRQLEKAILARLKSAAADGKIPAISDAERLIIRDLSENGRVGRVQDVANRLSNSKASNDTRAHIAFVGELSARFIIINETDNYYQASVAPRLVMRKKSVVMSIPLSKPSKNMDNQSTSKTYTAY